MCCLLAPPPPNHKIKMKQTNTMNILDNIKKGYQLKCFDEDGEELIVDYINADATNEQDIPDIVATCTNGVTFFYDDFNDAHQEGNEITIRNFKLQII